MEKAMKGKATPVFLVLSTVLALSLYVSAQVQQNTDTQQYRKAREAYEKLLASYSSGDGPYAPGKGAKAPVSLCVGPVMATDGTPKCLYQALPASGKLRIEMLNGSVQEIFVNQIKQITVE